MILRLVLAVVLLPVRVLVSLLDWTVIVILGLFVAYYLTTELGLLPFVRLLFP